MVAEADKYKKINKVILEWEHGLRPSDGLTQAPSVIVMVKESRVHEEVLKGPLVVELEMKERWWLYRQKHEGSHHLLSHGGEDAINSQNQADPNQSPIKWLKRLSIRSTPLIAASIKGVKRMNPRKSESFAFNAIIRRASGAPVKLSRKARGNLGFLQKANRALNDIIKCALPFRSPG
uniref:Uncharacterized protein n=1 Tax=Cannabis sativa TaxID=3483 RepID=A0A803P0X2_CANSA